MGSFSTRRTGRDERYPGAANDITADLRADDLPALLGARGHSNYRRDRHDLDLSRIYAAPSARLGRFQFEGGGLFQPNAEYRRRGL